jgi:hypothetical protein
MLEKKGKKGRIRGILKLIKMERYSKHGRNKGKNRFDEYLLAFFRGGIFIFGGGGENMVF